MWRNVEASCPGCQARVKFDVELPDPHVSVQLVEDSSRIDKLATDLTETQRTLEQSQGSVEALRGELERWQSGESHPTAQDMLNLLQSCPNCRPALETFIGEIRDKSLASLTPGQVKELARRHKLWPPPTINIPDSLLSLKARP